MYRMDRTQLRDVLRNSIENGIAARRYKALYPDGISDAELDQIIDAEIAARSTEQQAANELQAQTTRTQAIEL